MMTLTIGIRRLPVATLEEASRVFCERRDRSGFGASDFPDGRLYDAEGREIGRVSYNGRIWPPGAWTPQMQPLYDNR